MFDKNKIRDSNYSYLTEDICSLLKKCIDRGENRNFLDIGCGVGEKTLKWAEGAGIARKNVFGVDVTDDYLKVAKNKFNVFTVDFETQDFPCDDTTFDVITCSQVFEHIKNIHNLISEIFRVLKVGGYLILSTPNLASLHNRLLLLLGRQPTPIKIISEHIRGFTTRELKNFIQINPCCKVTEVCGSGFYPFMPVIGEKIAGVFSSLAVYTILVIQKTGDDCKNVWFDEYAKFARETHYFVST